MGVEGTLIVFLKLPAKGKVKTRLAKVVGIEAAVDLYRCCVSDTLAMIRRAGYPFLVFFYPPDAHKAVTSWLGEGLTCLPQEGGDLGERMFAAFRKALRDYSRAVLVGTDCPDLPRAILHEAFESLKSHSVVIGPSLDGGYYLIGFSTPDIPEALFKGIEWGSSGVFKTTMTAIKRHNLDVHILPPWRDIDEYQDLKELYYRQKDLEPGRLSTLDYLRNHFHCVTL